MSSHNRKPSIEYAVKAQVVPQSVAAAGSASSGWVSVAQVKWAKVLALVGAGGGTLAVKLEQATDSSGTSAKDLITAANLGITALDGTAKAAQADGDIPENIDVDNSFAYVRVTGTVTGGSGTIVSISLELGPQAFQS